MADGRLVICDRRSVIRGPRFSILDSRFLMSSPLSRPLTSLARRSLDEGGRSPIVQSFVGLVPLGWLAGEPPGSSRDMHVKLSIRVTQVEQTTHL